MQNNKLKPEKVFGFFSEISKIPRGSGNMEEIAGYCLRFAKERGLKSYRDNYGNVMIFKDGTAGYEQSESVILQGHLDMVCEKRPDCSKDMEHEGIDIVIDGEYLRADGTTLGGDNGIAIAYILALLDDAGTIAHPPIEALFTADEEVGLRGAYALDASKLTGKRLINMDSEEEGILTVSCAGAVRIACAVPVTYEKTDGSMCAKKVTVSGLLGGHSGIDIGRNRKNAALVLAEFLYDLSSHIRVGIDGFLTGGRLNVIPQTAETVICIDGTQEREFDNLLAAYNSELKKACAQTEPDVCVSAVNTPIPEICLDGVSGNTLISTLLLAPNGVSAISTDIPFLVQTSSNLGSVSLDKDALNLGFMIRSNTDHGKAETVRRLKALIGSIGGTVTLSDDYPAWEYRQVSPLRDIMIETYAEMYGSKPQICAIHAGLECGILAEKLEGADMISIGPNMKNVHTPDEQLEIKSVERCWEYLLRVLERLK
ncbi:MAG: aminoacyl-histidine dipeptidase [Lachnospiraceae bacterium]|nr:aminoacyl-histidine dipeptidase [Lachnospiraceae bacterium]